MPVRRFPAPNPCTRLVMLAAIVLTLPAIGCDEDQPKPPTQQAVEQSWQRTDQAVQQAAEAEQQLRHERRLREIDRLRAESAATELVEQTALLRGLALVLALTLLAALVWLAVEVRRRRVLTAVIQHVTRSEEEHHVQNPNQKPYPTLTFLPDSTLKQPKFLTQ